MPASTPHVDDAPYVEQSDRLNELAASFSVDGESDPPKVIWTCPVCHGSPQRDPIERTDVVGLDLPPLDLQCHCGHEHGDHAGCGYGATVTLPASVLEASE
jgi:hypothetical protein